MRLALGLLLPAVEQFEPAFRGGRGGDEGGVLLIRGQEAQFERALGRDADAEVAELLHVDVRARAQPRQLRQGPRQLRARLLEERLVRRQRLARGGALELQAGLALALEAARGADEPAGRELEAHLLAGGELGRRDGVEEHQHLALVHERDDVAFLGVALGHGEARRTELEALGPLELQARRHAAVTGVLAPVDVPAARDVQLGRQREVLAGVDLGALGEQLDAHELVAVWFGARARILDGAHGEQQGECGQHGVAWIVSRSPAPSPRHVARVRFTGSLPRTGRYPRGSWLAASVTASFATRCTATCT